MDDIVIVGRDIGDAAVELAADAEEVARGAISWTDQQLDRGLAARRPARRRGVRTVLTLAAATLVAAGCTGDDVNLAEAEAEMTNVAVDVIAQVSGEPTPNVTSERIACQDNLLRDNGRERASVTVGLNLGADGTTECG